MSWSGQVRVCEAGPHHSIQGYIGYPPPRIPQGDIEYPLGNRLNSNQSTQKAVP